MNEPSPGWCKDLAKLTTNVEMRTGSQGHTSTDLPSSHPAALLNLLHEYLRLPREPNARLNPRWLAKRLSVDERDLLNALAYAVLADLEAEDNSPAPQYRINESFNAELRGLPESVRVHRLRAS